MIAKVKLILQLHDLHLPTYNTQFVTLLLTYYNLIVSLKQRYPVKYS